MGHRVVAEFARIGGKGHFRNGGGNGFRLFIGTEAPQRQNIRIVGEPLQYHVERSRRRRGQQHAQPPARRLANDFGDRAGFTGSRQSANQTDIRCMNRLGDGGALLFVQARVDGVERRQRDGGEWVNAVSVKQRREEGAGGVGGAVDGGNVASVENTGFRGQRKEKALLGWRQSGKEGIPARRSVTVPRSREGEDVRPLARRRWRAVPAGSSRVLGRNRTDGFQPVPHGSSMIRRLGPDCDHKIADHYHFHSETGQRGTFPHGRRKWGIYRFPRV